MTRSEQLAQAFETVAVANHYMIGVVEKYSDDELAEAKQILIKKQNSVPESLVGKSRWRSLDLALDLVEQAERRNRQ